MNQTERRRFLIDALLKERSGLGEIDIPESECAQQELLRALFNVRAPGLPCEEVLRVQDDYLQQRANERGITRLADLAPVRPHIFLRQGDITLLACDAIVNAANEGLTGCWAPGHTCIDNCIHTFAGVQLRWECARIMQAQGHAEPTGCAKITRAYNLPCKHVIHTVGPIANGHPSQEQRIQLANCYESCYRAAKKAGMHSLAYCCISTGLFGFPQSDAARIAVQTVQKLQGRDPEPLDVVFNVFLDSDLALYAQLLK